VQNYPALTNLATQVARPHIFMFFFTGDACCKTMSMSTLYCDLSFSVNSRSWWNAGAAGSAWRLLHSYGSVFALSVCKRSERFRGACLL